MARRRNGLRAVLHQKQEASRLSAVERSEPFWKRREMAKSQQNYKMLQRHRALSQVRLCAGVHGACVFL